MIPITSSDRWLIPSFDSTWNLYYWGEGDECKRAMKLHVTQLLTFSSAEETHFTMINTYVWYMRTQEVLRMDDHEKICSYNGSHVCETIGGMHSKVWWRWHTLEWNMAKVNIVHLQAYISFILPNFFPLLGDAIVVQWAIFPIYTNVGIQILKSQKRYKIRCED